MLLTLAIVTDTCCAAHGMHKPQAGMQLLSIARRDHIKKCSPSAANSAFGIKHQLLLAMHVEPQTGTHADSLCNKLSCQGMLLA